MSKIDNTFGPGSQFGLDKQKPRQSTPSRAFGELLGKVDSEDAHSTHTPVEETEAPYSPFSSFFNQPSRPSESEPERTEPRAESRRPEAKTEEETSKPGYRPKRPLGRHYEFEKDPLEKKEELRFSDSSLVQPNPLAPFQVPMQIDRMPAVAETQAPTPIIQPQMIDQIVQDVRIGINAMGAAEFQFDLKSEVLDGLKLKISTQDGKVVASFIAENVHVKETIDQGAQELIQALQQRGLEVAEIQVSVGADTSGGQHKQHEHEQPSWNDQGFRIQERSTEPDSPEAINTNTRYTI